MSIAYGGLMDAVEAKNKALEAARFVNDEAILKIAAMIRSAVEKGESSICYSTIGQQVRVEPLKTLLNSKGYSTLITTSSDGHSSIIIFWS